MCIDQGKERLNKYKLGYDKLASAWSVASSRLVNLSKLSEAFEAIIVEFAAAGAEPDKLKLKEP